MLSDVKGWFRGKCSRLLQGVIQKGGFQDSYPELRLLVFRSTIHGLRCV